MPTTASHPSRLQRRSRADRTQRLHSFSRSWRRHLPTVALLTGLMSGLLPSAHAQTTNTWDGSSGDWNTATSWSTGFVPNGTSNAGSFYAVVNPAGGNDTLTHSSSTGTGGVDLIFSFLNGGIFNLTGGILAGSQANNGSTFVNNGTVNINGGTLRNFTVSGNPLNFSGSNGNILDSDVFQSNINLTGGVARILNSLTIQSGSSANISSAGYLSAANSATLTGTVDFTDGNGGNALATEGGDTLTLAAGSLVHGVAGQVGVAQIVGGNGTVVNHGTISSDGGSTIDLNPGGGTTNNGTLQAKNNSTLRLDDSLTNGTGGTLNIQDTSQILDNGTSITSGTVTGTGRMTFTNSNSNVLTGLTFSGATLDLTNGGIARVQNTLTLTGGSVANIAASAYLTAANNATLTGTVDFTDGNGGNSLATENGDTLTLAAGSLVHGVAGQVGVAQIVGGNGTVVNHGTISSDGGNIIALNAGSGTTSDGTLQAKNNSTLRIDTPLTNTSGGTLNAQDTSVIADDSTAITGGTVTGTGRMTFTNSNANVLTGLTFSGATLDLTNGGIARFTGGLTLTGGSVANIAASAYLSAATSTTLTGTVDFTDGNGGNSLSVENGSALTLAAGSLVHGVAGQVGIAQIVGGSSTVVNHGTISSDGGNIIVLNPLGGTTNDAGTIQAKQSGTGSTLRIDTPLTNINGGSLNIADTSSVIADDSTAITGGTVTGAGRMTFTNSNANVLTGLTFSGATLDLTNGGIARFTGGLTLTGGSVANIAASAYLSAATSTTLTGTVDFTDGNGGNSLSVENGSALTLAAGSLVHGVAGQVGVAQIVGGSSTVVNHGTISSDGGSLIVLNPLGGTTNDAGTLQAKNSSTLRLDDAVTNINGGTFNAQDTSVIADNSTSITGGTVTGTGRMTFTNSNANVLTGLTFSGATLDLTNGGIARVQNTLTLTGGSVANIAASAYLTAANSATLTGTVDFTDGNGGNSLATENGDTLTLASGSLVHGVTGQVGVAQIIGGNGTVINKGTISSDGGGNITINPATLTNAATGTIQASGGAVTVSPTLNNAGTVLVSSGSTLTANSGESQTGGVTQIDGTFTANNAPITLTGGLLEGTGTINGSTANVVNTSGTVKPSDSPGTLTIAGNYSQATAGHMLIEFTNTANGLLAVTGSATLGGILDVSYLGPAKSDGTYRINPGDPGTAFDFLSYGTLSNTDLGTLFSNEYITGGNFFVNGITADNFNGNPAVYQLTQDGGNALKLTLTTTATPEPSQWAAFGLGVLGLTGLALRARRKAAVIA